MKKKIIRTLCIAFSAMMFMSTAACVFATNANTEQSTKEEGVKPLNITIDIPLTDEEPNNIVEMFGKPAGTEIITGDKKQGEDDKEYNYSVYKVTKQGMLKVTTTLVAFAKARALADDLKLRYVSSDVKPSGGKSGEVNNDLTYPKEFFKSDGTVNENYFAVTPSAEEAEGFDYVYRGSGNISQFWPTTWRTMPEEGVDAEASKIDEIDGKTYYLDRNNNYSYKNHKSYFVEGLFINGEKVRDYEEYFIAIYHSAQQFVMQDIDSKETFTTYCADLTTDAMPGYLYNVTNIEDADYYNANQAAMIRTVAKNGYWGDNDYGDLNSVKKILQDAVDDDGNRIFTDKELTYLTDGAALTATQMSIWKFSNAMKNIEFVNAHFINKNKLNAFDDEPLLNDVPDYKRPTLELIFKIHNYLCSLDPISSEGFKDTSNTVINDENFLDDLTMTVKSKSGDDYIVDFNVKPSVKVKKDNGDDLAISFYGEDEEPLFVGRIVGKLQPGEKRMKVNEDGYYTLEDIQLAEGSQIMAIQFHGTQNLDKGVYLFKSENRDGETSQTMVGIAEGKKNVNAGMLLGFTFAAEDEHYEESRTWNEPPKGEKSPTGEDPSDQDDAYDGDGLSENDEASTDGETRSGDNFPIALVSIIILAVLTVAAATMFSRKKA